jgi:DNA-binding NarL/FixJ family response regulator
MDNLREKLTPRQAQIVDLMCRDCLVRKEIAKKLKLNLRTVDSHLVNIYKTLGVRNKTELTVNWMYERD